MYCTTTCMYVQVHATSTIHTWSNLTWPVLYIPARNGPSLWAGQQRRVSSHSYHLFPIRWNRQTRDQIHGKIFLTMGGHTGVLGAIGRSRTRTCGKPLSRPPNRHRNFLRRFRRCGGALASYLLPRDQLSILSILKMARQGIVRTWAYELDTKHLWDKEKTLVVQHPVEVLLAPFLAWLCISFACSSSCKSPNISLTPPMLAI